MRNRYFRDKNGHPNIKAIVYEKNDHCISLSDIDSDAQKICARLRINGYEGYIVGGAVRDLLLGKHPKDFDIATDAEPGRVRRIFSNSRIIGRRFRLVHIYFTGNKIYEVATFRAKHSGHGRHLYGTLYEDVMRRDFSINALYYDPQDETIIDFVGGFNDIQKRVITSVLPLDSSFLEDPVRMLRAVKYAALTNMRLIPTVGKQIKKQSSLLASASISRLGEELNKILKSRNTQGIFRLMDKYGLLAHLFPNFDMILLQKGNTFKNQFFNNLSSIDQMPEYSNSEECSHVLRFLLEPLVEATGILNKECEFNEVVLKIKKFLLPIVQPNRCIEGAVRLMFRDRNLNLPPKKTYSRDRKIRSGVRRHRKRYENES